MPWAIPAAIVGGSLISGYMGSQAASKGADAQSAATQASIDEQRRQFNALMERSEPFRQAQMSATNSLLAMEGLPLMSMGGGQGGSPQGGGSQGGGPTQGQMNDLNPPFGNQGSNTGMNPMYNPPTAVGPNSGMPNYLINVPRDRGPTWEDYFDPNAEFQDDDITRFISPSGPAGGGPAGGPSTGGGWIGTGGFIADVTGGPARIRRK